jgi:hypothetical protein
MPSRPASCFWSPMPLLTIALPTIRKLAEGRGRASMRDARCSWVEAASAPCAYWTFDPATSAWTRLGFSRMWRLWSSVSFSKARAEPRLDKLATVFATRRPPENRAPSLVAPLSVQPYLLVSPVAVDAVGGAHVSPHIGLATLGGAAMQDDRAGNVVVQNAFDLPNELTTLCHVARG